MNKIEIYLENKNEYKNKYNNKKVSTELFNYIINELKTLNIKEKITLEIYTNGFKLSDLEKENLALMIKSTFIDSLSDLEYIENKIVLKEIIYLLIGILIIIIYYIFKDSPVISEIILIIGWLMIWESIGRLVFDGTTTKHKIKRRKQIIQSKIDYID